MRWLFATTAVLLLSFGCASNRVGQLASEIAQTRSSDRDAPTGSSRESNRTARIIFIVRHAERLDETADPPLSAAGETRAAQLAHMLRAVEVTHLFATQFQRTRLTLEPLAEQAGLAVHTVDARQTDQLAVQLRQLPEGAVAVVAGHSNTVPELIEALGGPDLPQIEHGQYDRLFQLLLLEAGDVQLVELAFGAPHDG